jgi:hypothetical protein
VNFKTGTIGAIIPFGKAEWDIQTTKNRGSASVFLVPVLNVHWSNGALDAPEDPAEILPDQ